jgi:hypothetical protein
VHINEINGCCNFLPELESTELLCPVVISWTTINIKCDPKAINHKAMDKIISIFDILVDILLLLYYYYIYLSSIFRI